VSRLRRRFPGLLTVPRGQRYTSGKVGRVDSLSGAGIRRVTEKGKSLENKNYVSISCYFFDLYFLDDVPE